MRYHVAVNRSAFAQPAALETQPALALSRTTASRHHPKEPNQPSGWNFVATPVHEAQMLIQPKLTVNAVDDPLEQEADRVADEVTHVPGSLAAEEATDSGQLEISQMQRVCTGCKKADEREPIPIMPKGLSGQSCESSPQTDHEEEEEEKEETPVMAKPHGGQLRRGTEHVEAQLSRTRGKGSTLSNRARALMESRFGYDFSSVRIHSDANATEMAEELSAEAFTSGNDIYFNAGRYSPETTAGQRLLGHELTHVIQQGPAGVFGRSTVRNAQTGRALIQRYSLRGFPPAEKAAMEAAIPDAISKVKACPKLSWWGKWVIPSAIATKRYDYKKDLGACGWTFPASWYIEIGKDAFNTSTCCDLPSTIAHEASHTEFYTERKARKMECDCFACSC